MAFGDGRDYTPGLRSVRFGRKATKHIRTLFDRFWLQAADRRIVIYVRLTSSSGNWDADFLLLEVLRTHADEPWTAACDPKPTKASEP